MLLPLMLLFQQQTTVTATFAPTPVPRALEILSRASGMKLDNVPALADEVVLARLKNAPIDTALNHLAEAMCAKWVDRPGGIRRLTPDPAAERRIEQAKEAAREKDFVEGLRYIKKRLSEEPQELDADAVKATAKKKEAEVKRNELSQAARDLEHMFQSGNAGEETAGWRAAGQIALLIDPKVLLAMPDAAREVWAENPTPMQHPFPDGSDPILARYRRELSLTKPDVTVARVRIAVEREGSGLWVRFGAFDATGQPLDRELLPLYSFSVWTKLPQSMRPGYVPPGTDAPVQVPEAAKEARIALASPMSYRKPDLSAMIQKCRARFLDPVKFEPTQWHLGEDFVLAAEATDKNLIGSVSDSINGKFYFAGSRNANALTPKPSEILGRHKADLMPTNDGWLVVRSSEWRYRSSRSRAKALLDEGVRVGGITVDAAAAWVSESTEDNPVYDWMWDYLQVLFSGPGSFNSGWDGKSLKLWASLGQDNINALRHGATIQLWTLSPDAQAKIARAVYWYKWLDDNSVEPTDKLPTGISDGTLTMTVTESTVMHGCSAKDDPNLMINTITPENIGASQALGQATFRDIERWQIGVHRVYDLHFTINPGKTPMTVSLEESIFDPNSPTLSELPASVLTEIEKAKQYAIAHPHPTGG